MTRSSKRIIVVFLAIVLGLAATAGLAAYLGARWVQSRIVHLIEPYGHADRVRVRFSEVVLEGLTLQAGGPGEEKQLAHAATVVVEPDWRAFVSRRFVLNQVTVNDFSLPVTRTREGKIQILPALRASAREQAGNGQSESSPQARVIEIGQARFTNGTLDFRDAAVSTPPHRIVFDHVRATIGPLQFPQRTPRTEIDLSARAVGKHSKGPVSVQGWLVLASGDTDIQIRLRDVDVPLVAPYLQKDAPASLAGGSMALDMNTRIEKKHLNAQGKVTLSDLRLSDADTLFSLPRKAVLAALKDREGKTSFEFSVQGRLDDPKFALEDSLSARVAGGFAKAIGVSVQGVAEGVTDAVKGLGGAFSDLIGP